MLLAFNPPPGTQILNKVLRMQQSASPSRAPVIQRDTLPIVPPETGTGDTTTVDADGNYVRTVVHADGSQTVSITDPNGKLLQVIERDKDGKVTSQKDFRFNGLVLLAILAAIYFVFIHKF